jgi:hypothetical protein
MLKYSCSLLVLLLLSAGAIAQDRLASDSSRHKFLPTGIRIGTDMLTIGKTYYTDYFKGWEVNVDADVYRRFYVTMDYGSWASNFTLPNGVYANDGTYYRVGVDVNFLLKDPDRNMFFLGLRHGHSNFKDYSDYTYTDPNFGVIDLHAANDNAKANWKELTTGLRVKIWKFVWIGAMLRIKFRLKGQNQFDLVSYEVPGYGRTFKTAWYGLNYQLFIRIPVRDY